MNILASLGMAYLVTNFMALMAIIMICFSEEEFTDGALLLYPLIHPHLDDINLAGQIIVYVLFTTLFLPALIVYYGVVLTMTFLGCEMVKLFKYVFRKR